MRIGEIRSRARDILEQIQVLFGGAFARMSFLDRPNLNAIRKLEHGFGLRHYIRVISRNIGLRPINHNENLFRTAKLTIGHINYFYV